MLIYDWAEMIRNREAAEKKMRAGIMGAFDKAADGPRRMEELILTSLGMGIGLLWIGWRLGKR